MNTLLKTLRADAGRFEKKLIQLRRALHQHPETGWAEFETGRILKSFLAPYGLPRPVATAGTGFYFDITGSQEGPAIAYRADLDGLPIQDLKEQPYASKRKGFGHLCGHDVHSTIACGTALLIHRHRQSLKGRVRLFWQPAEEVNPSGAPRVMDEGVLDGIEAVYGLHCDPTIPSGTYSARPGAETGSFDTFEVTVETETTTHSARPYEGRDTIWISHQILQHFYQMIGRVTDVRKPGVLAICTFHAGNALNVMPHHVSFGGTLRTMDEQLHQQIRKYMTDIATGIGKLNGANVQITFHMGSPSVMNNPQMYRFFRGIISSELGENRFVEREQSIGAEDFAFYTQKIPGLFFRAGTAHRPETSFPLHHSRFDIDEKVIAPASALAAYVLFRHLHEKVLHPRQDVSSARPVTYGP